MTSFRDDPYPDTFIGGGFSAPTDLPLGTEPWDQTPALPLPDVEVTPSADSGGEAPGPHPPGRRATLFTMRAALLPGRAASRGVLLLTTLTVLAAVLLVFHSSVPNSYGNLGSLLETMLPWLGLMVPLTLVAALVRRSASAAVAVVLLAALWTGSFGRLFVGSSASVTPNLTVVTHNVDAANPDPASTARDLLAVHPDLIALEEVTETAVPVYERVLHPRLRYSVHFGTVALWSRYPITDSSRVVIDPGWSRSLRAEIRGPDGPLAVYVVHLASVRVGSSGFTAGRRDQTIAALAGQIDREKQHKVLLMGDFNGSSADRSLAPLTSRLASVQDKAGAGFGFSWPARFPFARIDQIVTTGITPTSAWTLPRTGSDHLPIAARLRT